MQHGTVTAEGEDEVGMSWKEVRVLWFAYQQRHS